MAKETERAKRQRLLADRQFTAQADNEVLKQNQTIARELRVALRSMGILAVVTLCHGTCDEVDIIRLSGISMEDAIALTCALKR